MFSGDHDPGLFVVSGKLSKSISVEQGAKAIWKELELIKTELVSDHELQKVKNKLEAQLGI